VFHAKIQFLNFIDIKMEENLTTKVQIDVPMGFDIKLDQWLIELKSKGIKTSKAKQIVKLAIIGFNSEVRDV